LQLPTPVEQRQLSLPQDTDKIAACEKDIAVHVRRSC
jgi:hypothetical protein